MMETEIATTMHELAVPAARPATAQPFAAPGAPPADLSQTWVAVLRADWSSLAVVPTDARTSARDLAGTLCDVARFYRLRAVRALDGTGAGASRIPSLLDEVAAARRAEERVAIAVENPVLSPAGAPLVLAADAALLLVRLGTSELRVVQAIAELVGRERVIGCLLVR